MPNTSGSWKTFGPTDDYSTGDANLLSLGIHVKKNIAGMLAITKDRRKGVFTEGGANANPDPTLCFVKDKGDGKAAIYYLKTEPGTDNTLITHWELYNPTVVSGGIEYKGLFIPASTTLVDGSGANGNFYIAESDGSFNGDAYVAGDWSIYDGAVWRRLPVGISALPPASHTHPISEIDGLQVELDNKLDTDDVTQTITNEPDKIPSSKAVQDLNADNAKLSSVNTFTGGSLLSQIMYFKAAGDAFNRMSVSASGEIQWRKDNTSVFSSLTYMGNSLLFLKGKLNATSGLQENGVNLSDKYALIGSGGGGGSSINDTTPSTTTTYSGNKIESGFLRKPPKITTDISWVTYPTVTPGVSNLAIGNDGEVSYGGVTYPITGGTLTSANYTAGMVQPLALVVFVDDDPENWNYELLDYATLADIPDEFTQPVVAYYYRDADGYHYLPLVPVEAIVLNGQEYKPYADGRVPLPGIGTTGEESRAELTTSTLNYGIKFQFRTTSGTLNITDIDNAIRDAKGVMVRLEAGTVLTFDAALNVEILTAQDTTKASYMMLQCIDKDVPLFVASFASVGAAVTPPAPTTPAAPGFANFDDDANTVDVVPATDVPMADYRYTLTGDATVYTVDPSGTITVSDTDVTVTVYSVADAGANRNQSPNATQVFTVAGSGGGGSYDADAEVYFAAVEATGATLDTTEKDAYNDWVVREKESGRYDKYTAIYPIMGGTGNAHRINAANPISNQLAYTGTWLHDASGMKLTDPELSTVGANTFFVPTRDDNHFALYINEDITSGGWDIGVADGVYSQVGTFGGDIYVRNSSTPQNSFPDTGMLGYHINTRVVSTEFHYVKAGTDHTIAAASESQHASAISIGYMGLTSTSSQRRYAFATMGDGLTAAEAIAATTSVNTLQTALGRA